MSENGQTHFKILQQMLQDFSVSDHFTTLRSKGLIKIQRVLNRLTEYANVRHRKNQMFL